MKNSLQKVLFHFLFFIVLFQLPARGAGHLHFRNEQQKNGFRIFLWMGADTSWKAEKWDSVLSGFHAAGIYGILISTDSATLARILPIAHNNGIRVEEWFIAMMNNDRELIATHPDWYVVNREGKSSVTDPAYVGYYRFLCPSNPEVARYLRTRLDEYLAIPGLDGIHLDYIRYPDVILPKALWSKYGIIQEKEYAPYDYCYCRICREKFRSLSGKDPFTMDHPEMNAEWRQFRVDQLSSLVTQLADYCHMKGKKISAAVFPGPGIAKMIVRQAWDKWPLDEVMPMLYHSFYNENKRWIRHETAEGVRSLDHALPLYSGLYIPTLSPRDLKTAIINSIKGNASGICLFNYESMTPGHWQALKELIRR